MRCPQLSHIVLPPRAFRRAVGMAFPAFTSSLLCIRSILLFNRAGVRDTEVSWRFAAALAPAQASCGWNRQPAGAA